MNVALRMPRMTRDEFFAWAEAQGERYEFDGFRPAAMTGGDARHSRIIRGLNFALHSRLKGGPCEAFGPDAGVATVGEAVRYPDAVVACGETDDAARLVDSPVVVFEVISPGTGRTDRVVKRREYGAVASIRRYVIVEHVRIGLTALVRAGAGDDWTESALGAADMLRLPEIGIEFPVAELYEGTGLDAARLAGAPARLPARRPSA